MSLLTKGVTTLSELGIDVDMDWLGHLIKNLGAPVDDGDAVRRQDAILKSLLTQAGEIIYASAPGAPAALAPETGDKFLKAGTPPSWSEIPAGGFWEKVAEVTLTSNSNTIEVTGLSTAYEIFWVILMSSWTHGTDIILRFNNDSGPNYDYSRFLFSSVFGRSAYDNANQITLAGPGGEGLVFYQFHGFIFQRSWNWRKTFAFTWDHANSANGSNSFHIYQGYWNNTTSKITGVRFYVSANYFDAQAKLLVLGAR